MGRQGQERQGRSRRSALRWRSPGQRHFALLGEGGEFATDLARDCCHIDRFFAHERFTGVASRQSDNITTGRIYSNVIAKERRGDYLGGTIQVVPHVTNEIKKRITLVAKQTGAQVIPADARDPVGLYFGTTSGELWMSRDEGAKWSCLARHLPEIYAVEAGELA
mgnify:CR=1 FL=1